MIYALETILRLTGDPISPGNDRMNAVV